MNRSSLPFATLALVLVSTATVQAQSVPLAGTGVSTATMRYNALPSVSRDPKGMVAPFNETASEAWVKEHIRAAGYSGVNTMTRDDRGAWHARAYKGTADVLVVLDPAGGIVETAR